MSTHSATPLCDGWRPMLFLCESTLNAQIAPRSKASQGVQKLWFLLQAIEVYSVLSILYTIHSAQSIIIERNRQ